VTLPGFNAERSLYKTTTKYSYAAAFAIGAAPKVIAQQFDCSGNCALTYDLCIAGAWGNPFALAACGTAFVICEGTCAACSPGTGAVSCVGSGPATACCAPNVNCCNGQCCPFASDQFGPIICCPPVVGDVPPFNNFQFGCHHEFACVG
jgi:hypothetical protein